MVRAWSAVGISIASFAASEYLISISPWFMLPFAWALAGTAFTGVRPLLPLRSLPFFWPAPPCVRPESSEAT